MFSARQEYWLESEKFRAPRNSTLALVFTPAVKLTLRDVTERSKATPSFNQVIEGAGMAKDSQENETFSPTILVLFTLGCSRKKGITVEDQNISIQWLIQ